MKSVTIRVPATSANLSCGFDVLGCAWNLYNTLQFTLSDHLSFSGCDMRFQNKDNLAYQSFSAVFKYLGKTTPPVHIDIQSDIPVCRGLGSSAAMLAAGALAASALSASNLTKEELLNITTPLEGHPDNLAPAFFGGLVASMQDKGNIYYVEYPIHESLHFSALSPDFPLSTQASRAALPSSVPFKDAVFNLSRLALLPKAFGNGDISLLSVCMSDRLHQPYRWSLISGIDDVQRIADSLGCRAFCISGAGPSLLCVSDDPFFSDKLRTHVSGLPHNWVVRDLCPDMHGAMIL